MDRSEQSRATRKAKGWTNLYIDDIDLLDLVLYDGFVVVRLVAGMQMEMALRWIVSQKLWNLNRIDRNDGVLDGL